MNDYIALLRADALRMFPGATSISIFINEEEVSVTLSYHGQLGPFKSMRTVDAPSADYGVPSGSDEFEDPSDDDVDFPF